METFSGRPLSDRAMRSGSRADIHFREAAVGFGGCDRNRAACFPGHLLGSIGLGSDVWRRFACTRDLGVVPGPNIPQPGGGLVVAFRCRDDGAVGH